MNRVFSKCVIVFLVVFLTWGVYAGLHAGENGQTSKEKININTASVSDLQKLPRIGEKMAQRIIDFRSKNGKFARIEDLMKVKGIGEKVYRQLKDLITVDQKT